MILALALFSVFVVILLVRLVASEIRMARHLDDLSQRVEDVEDALEEEAPPPLADRVVARVVIPGNGTGSISCPVRPARVTVPRGREAMSKALKAYGMPGRTWRPATDFDPMSYPSAFVTRWGHS